jgi:hypothetical protein
VRSPMMILSFCQPSSLKSKPTTGQVKIRLPDILSDIQFLEQAADKNKLGFLQIMGKPKKTREIYRFI